MTPNDEIKTPLNVIPIDTKQKNIDEQVDDILEKFKNITFSSTEDTQFKRILKVQSTLSKKNLDILKTFSFVSNEIKNKLKTNMTMTSLRKLF